ncbi:hypothetical protein FRC07_002885 [Ceratobasidium sp. 392]|nr:hypothetical protein FRC07_002885 [Ceratobasidium sp. 392]
MAAVVARMIWFGVRGRLAASFGRGGGSIATIESGTTFAGRSIGGASRGQIYGNRRYGSGYTYDGTSTSVKGRGFPFGYWPNFIPDVVHELGYLGYKEYGPASNNSRPGGGMQYAVVRWSKWPPEDPKASINNATASYYVVGDADSVEVVMDALVERCSVVNKTAKAIDNDDPAVHDEQAVQYYRASSFMLALSSYNNTANLVSSGNKPPPDTDTPLPAGTDKVFLTCVNATIADSIPILGDGSAVDAAPARFQALEGFNIVGLLWLLIWLLKMF